MTAILIYFWQAILEQGGLAPGGLNFDCKVRRESIALDDMFISHIGKVVTGLQPHYFVRKIKVVSYIVIVILSCRVNINGLQDTLK